MNHFNFKTAITFFAIKSFACIFVALLVGQHGQLVGAQDLVVQGTQYSADDVSKNWTRYGWEFEKGWLPVTDAAEVDKWGRAFEQAILDQNTQALPPLIEFQPMLDRCINQIDSEDFNEGFTTGVKTGVGQLLSQLSNPAGSYTFLGVRDTEFGPCAMMRMLDPNGGCNYHLWRFQKDPQGVVHGVDMYIYLSGESFGDTMRRMALISAPKGDGSFLSKLAGRESMFAEHQETLIRLIQSSQQKDFQGALDNYGMLPDDLKKEKSIMLMRILASVQISDDEYVSALNDYQAQFPNDASVDLVGIDLFFLKKQYTEMLQAIDRLEVAIGKDAHLCMLRSVGLSSQEKIPEARAAAEESIRLEPTLERPYWTLVEICLKLKDFDAVNDLLKQLCNKFGYNEFNFTSQPVYEEFIKTPQHDDFQEFLKTLKK